MRQENNKYTSICTDQQTMGIDCLKFHLFSTEVDVAYSWQADETTKYAVSDHKVKTKRKYK